MTAIRFAEWMLKAGYMPWVTQKQERRWIQALGPLDDENSLTTIQLYSLFLESYERTETTNRQVQEAQTD